MYHHLDSTVNPDTLQLYAPDPTAYEVFLDLFIPWIEQHHRYKIKDKYNNAQSKFTIPELYFRFAPPCWGDVTAFSEHIHLGSNIKLVEIQIVRSIAGLPFAPRMSVENYENVEKQVKEALKHLEPSMSGLYMTLNSTNWSPEMVEHLTNENILFDLKAELYHQPQR